MEVFKKQYKKLYKAYNKQLKKLHKNSLTYMNFNIEYLVTYLKLLRDYHALAEDLTVDGVDNKTVGLLSMAIEEYYNYKACMSSYFALQKGAAEYTTDIYKVKAAEKDLHWNNFWGLICHNLESWCE